jgi:tetratricopeptide (TPR) repeat protein
MDIPQTLKEKLVAGRVIPFVGAGVSMAVRHKDRDERLFPSWSELLLHSADRLELESKQPEAKFIRAGLELTKPGYLMLASHAKNALGPIWATFLNEQFNHSSDKVCADSLALPKLIWQLGSSLIITTNYEKVLRWSCPNPGDCEAWNIEHKAELAQFLGRQGTEKPTVWHLHGSIEDASRIILAQDGYDLLYSDDSAKQLYEAALHTFRSVLSSHTFIFIGFSFNDEHLGMQIQGMKRIFDNCTGPHYALVREDEKAHLLALNLPVVPITFSSFGQPLLDRLEDLTRCANIVKLPIASVPSVLSAVDNTADVPPVRPNFHPSNPVFHVPYSQKGSQVIGRDDSLAAVRKQLVEGTRTAIGHTASFKGLGGLGKTQLAVEYAYCYRDFYPNGIIWLTADQDIDAQLTELAITANWISPMSEHKDKLDVARQRLKSYGDCLIIFDNLEDQEIIRPYLPVPGTKAHILVTSRLDQPGFTPIPLDPLDPELSLELLYQESQRKAADIVEESAAKGIVTILGGLPLAIELAGAYLCHRKIITFADYLGKLHEDPLKALPEKFLSSFTGHDPDLFRTLKINEELFDEEPLLTPILDLLTWSGPAAMGLELMAHLFDQTEADLRGALALGVELRIVQKTPDAERYAIHRLVREVRKIELPLSGKEAWVENIASKLGDWFQQLREDFKELPRYEAEIDHLVAWCGNCCELLQLNARLTWLQAYPPYHRGNYKKAHDIVKLSMSMVDIDMAEPNELNANIYNDFGSTLGLIGDYKSSLRYYEKALAFRRMLLGDNNVDTASSYNNVGGIYGILGNHNKALEFQQRGLDIRQ